MAAKLAPTADAVCLSAFFCCLKSPAVELSKHFESRDCIEEVSLSFSNSSETWPFAKTTVVRWR